MPFEDRRVEERPVDRAATHALAGRARRLLVKAGREVLRFDVGRNPISEAQIAAYLVHEDGFLRVPLLVAGDLVVRGYTEELYREALDSLAGASARPIRPRGSPPC